METQALSGGGMFVQLLPLILASLPMVVGVWLLCPRLNANRWLWTIFMLIPIINMFVMMLFFLRIAAEVLNKLDALERRKSKRT